MFKEKLSYFVKDVLEFATHFAKTGQVIATEDKIKYRMSICVKCPKFTGTRCSACGCLHRAKVAAASSTCPLGHW